MTTADAEAAADAAVATAGDIEEQVRPERSLSSGGRGRDATCCLEGASLAARDQSGKSAPAPGCAQRWLLAFLLLAWCLYVATACVRNLSRARPLLLLTIAVACGFSWNSIGAICGGSFNGFLAPVLRCAHGYPRSIISLQAVACSAAFIWWLATDVWHDPYRLVPLCGLFVCLGTTFALSRHREAVQWRPVITGVVLQLGLAVLVLRTHAGFQLFHNLGAAISAFLDHVDFGCKFVFGEEYKTFFVAFKVLPIIIYFGSTVAVLYHLGCLPCVLAHTSRAVRAVMGTSGTESLVAAANIFIGQTESPLLIKPFLKDLTMSELHAVMTAGFATIAGGVLAAYVSFGVPAEHLVAASVLSCPAALAVAKLAYPETEAPRVQLDTAEAVTKALQNSDVLDARNVVDAAAMGASTGALLALNVAANLIAFLSLWSFLDGTVAAAGRMVDVEDLSIGLICSYLFWPLAFLMGVPTGDCFRVAGLLGEKTLLNEFVAYRSMVGLVEQGLLSRRAEVIATYALCGFSNVGSVGVQLGGLGALEPRRRRDMADVVLRAWLSGSVACFLTACVAGMLHP
eukprot:TRINITY_DN24702_c0_g2_i1.p1 TRINITY_DN24702_c0_g2~~TRINITY_DN24702_c0_g2_i1.p1  ORF type:complete len:571 (-),score=125.50 TRINITY_DN24702_c0_g2_i1:285-1997(-)